MVQAGFLIPDSKETLLVRVIFPFLLRREHLVRDKRPVFAGPGQFCDHDDSLILAQLEVDAGRVEKRIRRGVFHFRVIISGCLFSVPAPFLISLCRVLFRGGRQVQNQVG